jgi:hypothetical protein
MKRYCLLSLLIVICIPCFTQNKNSYNNIYSGVPWFDDRGKIVSAHGANIVKDNGRYYLFGEAHSDTSNAFVGFNCYSSTDLYNWKFESVALPLQENGKLGPNRVGERPKVMKCPGTGEYIMYMHVDTTGYTDQYVGYATASAIIGPYTFKGPLLFEGKPIKKWDMGTFQDRDGSGYVLLHGGDIFKLSNDYKSVTEHVNKAMAKGFESPAIFRKDSIYYFLGSDLTGWERNDNYYYTATSLKGPWTHRGFFAPPRTLTWDSQTSFVLAVEGSKDTCFMFMGDRWSFPRQASAATYVWQPLTVSGDTLSMARYYPAWKIHSVTGKVLPAAFVGKEIYNNDTGITYTGSWKQDTFMLQKSSGEKGASFSYTYNGTQVGFYGLARPDGGYAQVTIRNSKGKEVLSTSIDMYSKFPVISLKFVSPVLPKDEYTITVSVLGEHWYWKNKRGDLSGSKGVVVSFDKIVVKR